MYDVFNKGDYCNDITGSVSQFGIIVGLLPLEGTAIYSTKSHRVTVVGSATINNLITLYIGTDNGHVIQVRQNLIWTCSASLYLLFDDETIVTYHLISVVLRPMMLLNNYHTNISFNKVSYVIIFCIIIWY